MYKSNLYMRQFDSNRLIDIVASSKNIRNDARNTLKGFLYQFLVALDACFTLHKHQKLYIEKYGDYAIFDEDGNNTLSAEIKHYSDNLTLRHHNLINTLYNCIQESFNYQQYKKLYLITTQKISDKSPLSDWSNLSAEERYNLLKSNYFEWKEDLEKCNTNSPDSKKIIEMINALFGDIVKTTKKGMSTVLGKTAQKKKIVTDMLGRFVIMRSASSFDEMFANMLDERAGSIKEVRLREHFLYDLLGYIISPGVVNNDWCITFEDFTKKRQELYSDIAVQRRSFPDVTDPIDQELLGQDDSLYVTKLKDINFYKEIPDAIHNYVKVSKFLITEAKNNSVVDKGTKAYCDTVKECIRDSYELESLDAPEDISDDQIINNSKKFYIKMKKESKLIHMEPFGQVLPYFANGILHKLANDYQSIKWKLYE